ncbi:MAG: hypothetical protein Unbinned400contig1000_19 [Prokaryotic dsDNA virus sp.]|nr:MAG: hypothetical protein Unbinned400contig1000_19 [Prokaryotic dsDNA virus sp.]|tara:strand:+ start:9596 stop:9865 length:270 start_codon:yes stop_codon:yes gene_type:complete
MEDRLWEIAAQVPSLSVLSVVVWMFLKERKQTIDAIAVIADTCHKNHDGVHQRYRECIDSNTAAMREMVELIGSLRSKSYQDFKGQREL